MTTPIQKVYLNDDYEGTVVCAACGKSKTGNLSQFIVGSDNTLDVECSCGNVFTVSIDRRRHYRKKGQLHGKYIKIDGKGEPVRIVVIDISRSGLRFIAKNDNLLNVGDIIKVKFVLDSDAKIIISKNVIVRRVSGALVGGEFCDKDIPKPLAFYLLP